MLPRYHRIDETGINSRRSFGQIGFGIVKTDQPSLDEPTVVGKCPEAFQGIAVGASQDLEEATTVAESVRQHCQMVQHQGHEDFAFEAVETRTPTPLDNQHLGSGVSE